MIVYKFNKFVDNVFVEYPAGVFKLRKSSMRITLSRHRELRDCFVPIRMPARRTAHTNAVYLRRARKLSARASVYKPIFVVNLTSSYYSLVNHNLNKSLELNVLIKCDFLRGAEFLDILLVPKMYRTDCVYFRKCNLFG